MAPAPEFPAPFVIERTRTLGFGTGPWTREQLVERWGTPTADKFIGEAKAAGWLVTPYRGTYFVPAAQDLMVVSWLPEPARAEFLVSRTLASADLPFWCLSEWCRRNGLELGAPVFVTDLGAAEAAGGEGPRQLRDRKAARDAARKAATTRLTLPFLDNLLIVPLMPGMEVRKEPAVSLVPEPAETVATRRTRQVATQGIIALIGLASYALTKEAPVGLDETLQERGSMEKTARGIAFSVGPAVSDPSWTVALLAALGTPRIEELVSRLLREKKAPDLAKVQRWAGWFGPPQPVAGWKEAIQSGPFPFLLVPPALWSEMGADQAARRFRMLERVGGG